MVRHGITLDAQTYIKSIVKAKYYNFIINDCFNYFNDISICIFNVSFYTLEDTMSMWIQLQRHSKQLLVGCLVMIATFSFGSLL